MSVFGLGRRLRGQPLVIGLLVASVVPLLGIGGVWAEDGPTLVAASPAASFGGRVLSAEEASEVYGLTSDETSSPFPVYLWIGFALRVPPGTAAALSDRFILALSPDYQPPDSGLAAQSFSAAFLLSTTLGQSLPSLVGTGDSPALAIYLAAGFRVPPVGLLAEQGGPLFSLDLGKGFTGGAPGNVGLAASDLFPVYLARGFVGGAMGETGSASGSPFELRLIPTGGGGLIAFALSPDFDAYLAGDFLLARDGLFGGSSATPFTLVLNSGFRLPPPQLIHAVASPAFVAYIVPDFVLPAAGLRADAPSLPFVLELLALAGGREGYGFSPPFELNLYVYPTPTLASVVEAKYVNGVVRISWQVHDPDSDQFAVMRSVTAAQWGQLSGLRLDGRDRLLLVDEDVSPGRRYGYRLLSSEDPDFTLSEVWFDIPLNVLSLLGAVPNPSPQGRLLVRFTLPDASPARLEVLDVAGRRVAHEEVGSYGPGAHTIDLGQGRRLPAGIYWVRLSTPARSIVRKAHVLN